jgi:hypothetical protein
VLAVTEGQSDKNVKDIFSVVAVTEAPEGKYFPSLTLPLRSFQLSMLRLRFFYPSALRI